MTADDHSPGASLKINLFGAPAVRGNDGTLAIPRRLVRAVLFYLAVQEHAVSRSTLCLLFWPDIPDAQAHRNLTRLLAHLRMALPDPGLLVTSGDTIDLDRSRVWCDALEYARASKTSLPAPVFLAEATAWYTGPFLTGLDLPGCPEFDLWASSQRSAFESLHLENLARLITGAAARQQYAAAIEYANRYLGIDPLAEEMHRQLIWLYGLSGQRSRALHQFETCVSVLEQQLGTGPLPETRAIYQAVLKNQLPAILPPLKEEPQLTLPGGLQLQVPMIGRSEPLRALVKACADLQSGKPGCVLITGEPGIGKSRLLHDFIQKQRNETLILYGSGQHGEESIAFHPIVEALRSHTNTTTLQLQPYWLSEVSRLLPEINSLYPNLPRPIKTRGNEARVRLFEALSQYLLALQSTAGSLVLCIDDLHWCDRTSLSWLSYFARQLSIQNAHVVLICTCRVEDLHKIRELRDCLAHLQLLTEIQLPPLSTEDVLELVQHLHGPLPGSTEFAARLTNATGGNPFYLLEVLKSLAEEGKAGGELSQLAFPLPEGARTAINRRLDRLNARSRQVIEAGAVLGSTFELRAAALTAGRNEMDTATSLADLITRQLIKESASGYRFSHDLIFRATLAEINPMRLQLLHRRAGQAIQKVQPEMAALLAYHYENGGEPQLALTYHERAAHQAQALFAWQEALTHYVHMERILDHLETDSRGADRLAQRIEVLREQARLNQLQGQLPERDGNLAKLNQLSGAVPNRALEAQLLLVRAQYLHQDGCYEDAVRWASQAMSYDFKDDHLRCRLLIQLGFSLQFIGQPQQALAVLEQAHRIADATGDTELRAEIMDRMALIQRLFGNYQEALECELESHRCYSQLGDPYRAARCLIQVGFNYVNLGQFDEAASALQQILDQAQKAGVRSDEAHALIAMGGLNNCKGENAAAVRCFDQALLGLQPTRLRHLIATAQAGQGIAWYHLGDYAQSRRWMEKALTSARAIDHRMRIAQILVQMGMLDTAEGQFQPARERLMQGIDLARESHSGEDTAAGLAALARLERLTGNLEQAQRCAEDSLAVARDLKLTPLEVWARVEAALIHLALGQPAQAEGALSPALTLAATAHQRWLGREDVHLAHASVLDAAGEALYAADQRQAAAGIISGKAGSIANAEMRQHFLRKYGL